MDKLYYLIENTSKILNINEKEAGVRHFFKKTVRSKWLIVWAHHRRKEPEEDISIRPLVDFQESGKTFDNVWLMQPVQRSCHTWQFLGKFNISGLD